MRALLIGAIALVALYGAFVGVLYANQRALLYPRSTARAAAARPASPASRT